MKKIFCFCLALCLSVGSVSLGASAACGHHWYVPRNGHNQPHLPAEESYVEKYDAYYMNTALTDDSDRKVIYLTFDAGYENGNVAKILDILKEENVPAAFFILDHMVLHYTDIVKRMKAEGHLVCNHTKNHKNMASLTTEEMKKNLSDMEKIYEENIGMPIDKYFRFPEGCFDEKSLACAKDLGYKTIFWSFGYNDWDNDRQPDPAASVKKILDNTHNGEVVLMHPTSATNAAILKELIGKWRAQGYTFGTLEELTRDVDNTHNQK